MGSKRVKERGGKGARKGGLVSEQYYVCVSACRRERACASMRTRKPKQVLHWNFSSTHHLKLLSFFIFFAFRCHSETDRLTTH